MKPIVLSELKFMPRSPSGGLAKLHKFPFPVIPAKAGIQANSWTCRNALDSRLRGNDKEKLFSTVLFSNLTGFGGAP